MKRAILLRVLAIILVALFICASLLKSAGWYSSFFQAAEWIVGGDKLLHVMAAFCLSFLVNLAANTYHQRPPARLFNLTFICLFIFLSADELMQLLSIYRRFSFADLAANYVGLLLGWGVSRLLMKTTSKNHNQSSQH